jgi:hypothetical protein
MASNAASSVQFHVNGTEIARGRTRKTDRRRSADPRAKPTPQCTTKTGRGARILNRRPPCAQGSERISILLARLAFLYIVVQGFGPSLAAAGPKLDPSVLPWDACTSTFLRGLRLGDQTALPASPHNPILAAARALTAAIPFALAAGGGERVCGGTRRLEEARLPNPRREN